MAELGLLLGLALASGLWLAERVLSGRERRRIEEGAKREVERLQRRQDEQLAALLDRLTSALGQPLPPESGSMARSPSPDGDSKVHPSIGLTEEEEARASEMARQGASSDAIWQAILQGRGGPA